MYQTILNLEAWTKLKRSTMNGQAAVGEDEYEENSSFSGYFEPLPEKGTRNYALLALRGDFVASVEEAGHSGDVAAAERALQEMEFLRTDQWLDSNAAVLPADHLRDYLVGLFRDSQLPSADALAAVDALFLHQEEAIYRDDVQVRESDSREAECVYLGVWARKLSRDSVAVAWVLTGLRYVLCLQNADALVSSLQPLFLLKGLRHLTKEFRMGLRLGRDLPFNHQPDREPNKGSCCCICCLLRRRRKGYQAI